MPKPRIAVYPGSFDPITMGHVDIACRASKLFDGLILAVYDTPPTKTLLFSTEERVALAKEALRDVPNVRVNSFQGLTVDYARSVGAQILVRGLRATSDFELEFQWSLMNRKLSRDIEVVCLVSSLRYIFTSSSNIKEVARLRGDVTGLVPAHVARALAEKYGHDDAARPAPRYLAT